MSNKTKLSAAQINEQMYLSALGKNENPVKITRKEAYEILMSAPEAELIDLNGGEYFKFEGRKVGEMFAFVVRGLSAYTSKSGDHVKIVQMEDFRDGKQYVCGAAVLYNACERLTQLPCLIRVTYQGEEKAAKGMMTKLKVEAFPSTAGAPPVKPANANGGNNANGASGEGGEGGADDLPF